LCTHLLQTLSIAQFSEMIVNVSRFSLCQLLTLLQGFISLFLYVIKMTLGIEISYLD